MLRWVVLARTTGDTLVLAAIQDPQVRTHAGSIRFPWPSKANTIKVILHLNLETLFYFSFLFSISSFIHIRFQFANQRMIDPH